MAFDWFSGLIGYDATDLPFGRVLSIQPGGEIEWERERWESAEGSHSATVQVTRDVATAAMRDSGYLCSPAALRVSGNPTKYLQGHNAFGPSVKDAGAVLQGMVRAFPDVLRPRDADEGLLPAVHRSRYDIAVHVDLGQQSLVREWLRAAGSMTRSRHGRALVSGSTVYWGKSSRRWSMKAYSKFDELMAHPPATGNVDELLDWCEGHLRLELTLRRKELVDRDTLREDVVWEYYEKLTIGVSEMEVTPDNVDSYGLGNFCKMSLRTWLRGADVRRELPRATFYRYRREILDRVGVDISLPREKQWGELEQLGFDVHYLKQRQVASVPQALQHRLFKIA